MGLAVNRPGDRADSSYHQVPLWVGDDHAPHSRSDAPHHPTGRARGVARERVPPMSRLTRRQRRALHALGRDLQREDPELAAQLSHSPEPPRVRWARNIATTMALLGVLLVTVGLVAASAGTAAMGSLLLITCWMPPRIAASDPTLR